MASTESAAVCSICLEDWKKPITLPCNHTFCYDCLEQWRSKYGKAVSMDRSCPNCRSKVPPSREMITQVKTLRRLQQMAMAELGFPGPLPVPSLDEKENFHNEDLPSSLRGLPRKALVEIDSLKHNPEEQQAYLRHCQALKTAWLQKQIDDLEAAIGDFDEGTLLEEPAEDRVDELPEELKIAAALGDIRAVLKWLGPEPIPPKRINAKQSHHLDRTLLHEAEFEGQMDLMKILLRLGAKVDPKSSYGSTPFDQACSYSHLDQVARLLLTWGAEYHPDNALGRCLPQRNPKLYKLLQTPLGGRRCETIGYPPELSHLNGKVGVATNYISKADKYVLELETSGEKFKVKPENLKRRDRTPEDVGTYYS